MAKKRYYGQGMYVGYEDRMNQESLDSGMIKEDKSAIANLPQNVMIKDWPKADYGAVFHLDDTIHGIDVQMRDDAKRNKDKSQKYPEKY